MRKFNLIVVFNEDLTKTLFCIRAKEPYKGLYNLVGGKVEKMSLMMMQHIENYMRKQEYQQKI